MEGNQNKQLLKKLLDRLQEDSWQLELLVSGFTIFGLFNALGPVGDAFQKAIFEDDILKDVYQTVFAAILILIFNLIIHVILRSIWIGALGMRYVSGEVKIEKLKYTKRFSDYLNKKVGSFDDYIERLEKLCSVIFAVSFLLIFYVAALFIVMHLISLLGSFNSDEISVFPRILLVAMQWFISIGAILTFIDYLSQGLLKRNKWIAAVYFPFYWLFGYITLSFLYRPLFYNLIDNKFGRKVSLLILPFYLSIVFLANMYKDQSGLISFSDLVPSEIIANNRNYEDLVDKDYNIYSIAIQSKVITDPYIKVKIPLNNAIENRILQFNKGLKPYERKNRYRSALDGQVSIGSNTLASSGQINTDSIHLEYVQTFQNIYMLKIDSVLYKTEFVISLENDLLNFETYIGTNELAEGKHLLVYSRYKGPENDSIVILKEIPFWYYKN